MKDKTDSSRFWKKVVWAFILAAPSLLTGRLIYRYGVDIPYWDQWDGFCPLLEKMDAGTLRLVDLFALHNEHRIFFPRLIMFSLAKLTHWNIRAELLVIWLLAWVCAANLWRLARVTGWGRPVTGCWLLLAANVLLFTPLEQENWIWGFQIGFLLPSACITACLWMARSVRFPINFLLCMVLSTICTFSGASGFTCWVLTFPLLLFPTENVVSCNKKGWSLIWLLGFLISLFLYFHGYKAPSHHMSAVAALNRPIPTVQYFLAYLGGPFAHGTAFDATKVAQPVGAVLALAWGATAAYLWRCHRDGRFIAQALPWLTLTLFALVSAALTAAGRQSFGVAQALNARYLAFSVMLPIGLLFLAPLIFNHWRARTSSAQHTTALVMALSSVAAALVLLHGLGSLKNLETWPGVQHHRLTTKSLVLFINVTDEPEGLARFVHAIVPPLKDHASFLDRLGYLRPGLVRTNAIRDIAGATLLNAASFGEIQQAGKPSEGQFAMAGWAVLPDKARAADAVLLTYDDANGEPIIFALAIVETPRMDVANSLQQAAYLRSGWVKTFNASRLPPGARLLRAWAFDAKERRAYPIQGVVTNQP